MALVAIYDSGVGGLSIAQEVMRTSPEQDYLFLSDNQAFPYGTKAKQDLLDRSYAIIRRLDENFCIDVLIVACNTASTAVLPMLRERFNFDVIGVVPAVKPAAQLSNTKHIALLATPATVERSYTDELIERFASECTVTKIGSSELVLIAEEKLYGLTIDQSRLDTILRPVIENTEIDVLVLACTHFPLLRNEIEQCFLRNARNVSLIDSGEAIAKRLVSIVGDSQPVPSTSGTLLRTALISAAINQEGFTKTLAHYGFDELQLLSV